MSAGRCVKFFEPIDVRLIEHRWETARTSNNDEMLGKAGLDEAFGSRMKCWGRQAWMRLLVLAAEQGSRQG